jgi:hypothetical protein
LLACPDAGSSAIAELRTMGVVLLSARLSKYI